MVRHDSQWSYKFLVGIKLGGIGAELLYVRGSEIQASEIVDFSFSALQSPSEPHV